MKIYILMFICLLLVGCSTPSKSLDTGVVDTKIATEESRIIKEAAASASATQSLLAENAVSEAIQTNQFTVASLPRVDAEKQMEWNAITLELKGGKRDALDGKFAKLVASQKEIEALTVELEQLKARIVADAERQRDEAEKKAETALQEAKRMQLLQKIFGGGAILVLIAGGVAGFLLKSLHITAAGAAACAFLGFLATFLSNVPGWVFQATPFLVIGFIIWMIISYRNGLNKPVPEKKLKSLTVEKPAV